MSLEMTRREFIFALATPLLLDSSGKYDEVYIAECALEGAYESASSRSERQDFLDTLNRYRLFRNFRKMKYFASTGETPFLGKSYRESEANGRLFLTWPIIETGKEDDVTVDTNRRINSGLQSVCMVFGVDFRLSYGEFMNELDHCRVHADQTAEGMTYRNMAVHVPLGESKLVNAIAELTAYDYQLRGLYADNLPEIQRGRMLLAKLDYYAFIDAADSHEHDRYIRTFFDDEWISSGLLSPIGSGRCYGMITEGRAKGRMVNIPSQQ